MATLHGGLAAWILALGAAATGAAGCGGPDADADDDGGSGGGDSGGGGEGGSDGMGELTLGIDGATAEYLAGFPEAIEPQGDQLLIAGRIESDFWVTRVSSDGALDETFGDAGNLEVAFPEGESDLATFDFDIAYSLHVTDNSIFVGGAVQGFSGPFETRWGVAKLDEDGALDTAFADDGLKVIDWTIGSRAYQVRTDADDRIYVGGTIDNTASDMAIVRMLSDGSVDNTFQLAGPGAGAVLSDGNAEDGICLVLNSERVLAAGGPEFGTVALGLDGQLDASFGDAGWSKPAEGIIYALSELPDGKFYAVGTEAPNADSRVEALLMLRLLSDGTLDDTFADGGIARLSYDFGSYVWPDLEEQIEWQDAFVRVNGFSVLPDGGAMIYADALGFLARYPILLRVTPEGELDTSFGQGGLAAFPLGMPLLAGILVQPASRLASDGTTAWLVDQFVFEGGNRGVLITVDLDAL